MEIEIVGLYSPGPKADGAGASGYLVRENGKSMLVDCGPGVVATLQQRHLTDTIDSVYITHWHADHSYDLLPLCYVILPELMTSNPDRKRTLHVPKGGKAFLESVRGLWPVPASPHYNDPFKTVFDIREYEPNEVFEDAGWTLETVSMKHAAPCSGVKVTGNSGRVAFSGDTGWCDNLPRLAEDVGVFVCEATLSQPDTSGHGHLCGKDAGRAAAIAKPKNLLLTHFHSDAPEFIAQQRQDALSEFPSVVVAKPALVLPVER